MKRCCGGSHIFFPAFFKINNAVFNDYIILNRYTNLRRHISSLNFKKVNGRSLIHYSLQHFIILFRKTCQNTKVCKEKRMKIMYVLISNKHNINVKLKAKNCTGYLS